jgi:hypothetical protein
MLKQKDLGRPITADTDKGFIRFAALESREAETTEAANVMKPLSELNGESSWLFNGFCSVAALEQGDWNWVLHLRWGKCRKGNRGQAGERWVTGEKIVPVKGRRCTTRWA